MICTQKILEAEREKIESENDFYFEENKKRKIIDNVYHCECGNNFNVSKQIEIALLQKGIYNKDSIFVECEKCYNYDEFDLNIN